MNKPNIIGYSLYGHDNDTYVLLDRLDVDRCADCGELLSRDVGLSGIRLKKKYDLSYTYDGYLIASDRFRSYCVEKGFEGIEFDELPDESGYYVVKSNVRIEFDPTRRKTRFEGRCPYCGRFKTVVGSSPAMLRDNSALKEGVFFWSDLEFGGGDEKHPLLLVGLKTGAQLKKNKFSGFDVGEIWE